MTRRLAVFSRAKLPWLVGVLLAVSFLVTGHSSLPRYGLAGYTETVIGSDSFNRANGSLGAGWTDDSDAGLSIVSGQVVGNGGNSGDLRTAESYPSDQFSQLLVGSTPLSGGQWIGPAVRMQASGQSGYVGFYYANNGGTPEVMLFKRAGGVWSNMGSYSTGVLAEGTQLQVTAVGSTISLLVNGVTRVTTTDSTLTGGVPGILASGSADAGAWSGGSMGSGSGTKYSVGGTVSGLSGTVVLQDNGGDTLSVSANGSFTFATHLASGAAYAVTVQTNPSGQACTVSNGSGTVGSANVTSVAVSCATSGGTKYSVGGTVSGLSGTVVLQDNGSDSLSVSANGSFTFATQLASGAAYAVTVQTNPSGQTCTVSNGSGTVGSANVTSVAVSCATSGGTKYSVGGTVSGLSGTVVLQDNGSDSLSVSANGSFTFATQLASGAAYAVTVQTNPSGQTCTVSNGSGTVGSANVTSVAVSCATSGGTKYSVGGTVSGLSGTVVLQDNGSDSLSVSANGSFTFATQLASGAAYAVTVQTNPSGQTCTVSNGSGTVGSANVTGVAVSCATSGGGGSGQTVIGSDNFNRANGSLGAGWTDDSDGGLSIVSGQVVGNGGNSGDLRTAESYPSDQFSQLLVGSTPLSGGQWIGPAVRMQASGQSGYVGFYYANN